MWWFPILGIEGGLQTIFQRWDGPLGPRSDGILRNSTHELHEPCGIIGNGGLDLGFPMVFPWFSHGFPMVFQFPHKKKKKSFSRARAPTRQSKLRWEGAIHRLILLVFLCQKKYMWPDRELRTGIIRCPMHPPYAGGASRARPLAPQLCYEKMTHVGQKTTKSNNPLKGLSWGKWIYHTSTNLMVPLI